MAIDGLKVCEFQIEYPPLNLNEQIKNEKIFDYGIIICYMKECENGFKVKKVGKTTRKGTTFTYEQIKTKEDYERYKILLDKMVSDFNAKYNENLKIVNS